PYTVADEAQIPRITLLRNKTLMDLVAQEKHGASVTADETIRQLEELEECNRALEERIAELELEKVSFLKDKQDAWQQGYEAGLREGLAQGSDIEVGEAIDLTDTVDETCVFDTSDLVAQDFSADTVDELELPLDGLESVLEECVEEGQSAGDSALLDYQNTDDPDVEMEEPLSDEQMAAGQVAQTEFNQEELRDLLKYRFGRSSEVQQAPQEVEVAKPLAGSKFVGGKRATEEQPPREVAVRNVPPNVRKACLVLGLRPEELTRELVHKAWKKEMTNPGTHPDIGGETEIAIYINTARDTLYRWLDAQAPKLGKKFGTATREMSKVPDKPLPENPKSEDFG
ncbi:MAG: hypothetical protein HY711_03255, partial [Candidatus Melainabacteria bacterium]|nr:hypothetical protein [Candidatus Melainabacteria bacterium]